MNNFEAPVCIAYRPPRGLFRLVCGIHAGAICGVWLAALPTFVRIAFSAVIAVSAWRLLRTISGERNDDDAFALRLDGRDAWSVRKGDEPWQTAMLLPGAFVHPACQVLRLNTQAGRRTFILTPGNVPDEVLRRLRVRLRYPIGA